MRRSTTEMLEVLRADATLTAPSPMSPAQVVEALRLMLTTDPHSPPAFRVLGPLYNTPEFFQAFQVTPEQAVRYENPRPVQIW